MFIQLCHYFLAQNIGDKGLYFADDSTLTIVLSLFTGSSMHGEE